MVAPLAKGIVFPANVFTIGQVISGVRSVDASRTTVFKSVGMALYDLHVARALYAEATRLRIGREVAL